ncbi:MAG: LamG-like jellyroll fold domain-containing protein, partial [Promethearchaeota archaeon]
MKINKKTSFIVFILFNICISITNNRIQPTNTREKKELDLHSSGDIENIKSSGLATNIYINASKIIRELPSDIFGSNIQYIEHGDGILDPETHLFRNGIVEKAKATNISTIRFPGGGHADVYHWWYGIGPVDSRPNGTNYFTGENVSNDYGIDEHYDFCQNIGAKPTITVNFGTGTPQEAANWVEYCNGKVPTSGTGGWTPDLWKGNESADPGYFAWLRDYYGHSEPYNITKWEVGNEVYNDWTNNYNATEYAMRFLDYNQSMKAVDPTIKIAAIGYEDADGIWGTDSAPWNQEVARIAGNAMDALHIHTYIPVDEDGYTVFFFSNKEESQTVYIPAPGDYEIEIIAQGFNGISGTYPLTPNSYSNLSINVNGESKVNITLNAAAPRIYKPIINFGSTGNHDLGIEFTNDGPGKDAMIMGDVYVKSDTEKILVRYTSDPEEIYEKVMAGPLYLREEIENISEVLRLETGRDDIEIWVTEVNTMYQIFGFRTDQTLEFKSALALADIGIQYTYAGVDSMQQWSLVDDWYFGMITNARTLGHRSSYDTYSLLNEGWGQYLLNSTVDCQTYDNLEPFGRIPIMSDIPYLDVMPTITGDELMVTMINKHPTEFMDINMDIEGFKSSQSAVLKIINSSAADTIDQNPPDEFYEFGIGKIDRGVKLNASSPILYPSRNNAFPDKGTIEFWIKPDWDGDDYKLHPIMSIGQTFILFKAKNNYLFGFMVNDMRDEIVFVAGGTTSWSAGDWHYVAITWDTEDSLKMYIDGTETWTSLFFNNRTYFDHRNPMIIGSYISNRSLGLDGMLDELRISNISRSASEIQNNFNNAQALLLDGNTTILFHFDGSLE